MFSARCILIISHNNRFQQVNSTIYFTLLWSPFHATHSKTINRALDTYPNSDASRWINFTRDRRFRCYVIKRSVTRWCKSMMAFYVIPQSLRDRVATRFTVIKSARLRAGQQHEHVATNRLSRSYRLEIGRTATIGHSTRFWNFSLYSGRVNSAVKSGTTW